MAGQRTWSPQEYDAAREEQAVERLRARAAARDSAGGRRPDTPPFAHLQVRSTFSMREGTIRPRELAAAAAASGMSHVALTDRDGLYGAVRFARAAAAEGVVPVFGTDLALEGDRARPGWGLTRAGRRRRPSEGPQSSRGPDRADPRESRPARGAEWLEDDAARVTLLAATQAGYGDLCRTVSAAHAAARSDPHLASGDLGTAAASDGVVALLGVDSPVGRLVACGRLDAAAGELRRWLEVFGSHRVVLGVRDHRVAPGARPVRGGAGRLDPDEPGDDVRIRRTLELAARVGVRAVAVNDVRYLRPRDVVVADVLRCVRQQVPLATHHLGRSTSEAWLTTPADQHARFAERPSLLSAAYELATSCEVDLGLGGLHVPRLSGLAPEAAAGELHRRCWEGVAARYPRVTPQLRARLEDELAMVDRLGIHDLFLAVAVVVADVRAAGVIVACRGSAAGSLVCYALRISDVDPIANALAFERFMNPYRDELPDIDLDVESHRREDVYDLVMGRFGEERTACVAMIETFQARMAVREVGKVLGVPREDLDAIARGFTRSRARDVRRSLAELPELRGSNLDGGLLRTLLDVVERIDGFPRHVAMHPCGILLGDADLLTRTPLERSAHGYSMSQFDKDDVAALGLLKLDVLGVRMLSAMRHCLELVNGSEGREPTRAPDPEAPGRDRTGRLSLDAIPHDDPPTYELIRSAQSVGMFQIESPGQRELLGRLQPRVFGDLITEISLFRPGPVKADMVTPYVARRQGEEAVAYAHQVLAPVLAETGGVIVYHEQVMGVISVLTGCDLAYADLVRRQLADDAQHERLRSWVVSRGVERGLTETSAAAVWEQLAAFASFGFCKAHAAAFAVPTERSAFLKTHVFPEFLAGLLTHDPGMYPRRMLLDECRLFGVAVLCPDVNRSLAAYTVETVTQELADARLGLPTARPAGVGAGQVAERLPPGWRWPATASRPVPPSGYDAGNAGEGRRYAVRVGLQDVAGITDVELAALVGRRPFVSLADLRARAGLSRTTVAALVDGGALDQLTGVGRPEGPPDRRALSLLVEEQWQGHRPAPGGNRPGTAEQPRLELAAERPVRLPAASEAACVRAELAVLGMDVSRHVVSFYDPLLEALGVTRACDLAGATQRRTVRVAGVKVAVQSPAQRSGQRVLFLSLDDATGQTQTTYFERSLDDCAWTVLNTWLLVAEGRVTRRGPRGATVTGTRAWDLTRLWRAWQQGGLDEALAARGTPAAHQRTVARPGGLTASEFGRGSR